MSADQVRSRELEARMSADQPRMVEMFQYMESLGAATGIPLPSSLFLPIFDSPVSSVRSLNVLLCLWYIMYMYCCVSNFFSLQN